MCCEGQMFCAMINMELGIPVSCMKVPGFESESQIPPFPGRQQVMVLLSLSWKTWIEFLAPSFCLARCCKTWEMNQYYPIQIKEISKQQQQKEIPCVVLVASFWFLTEKFLFHALLLFSHVDASASV